MLFGVIPICINHPLVPLSKKAFLFPAVWPSTYSIYTWHLFPYPYRQSRKRMINTLLVISICSKTFTKAKKSALCAEYLSIELKNPFIQMENILKIELWGSGLDYPRKNPNRGGGLVEDMEFPRVSNKQHL